MTTGVVILAGGEGLRIGGGKPVRILAGQRLIDRAIDYARRLSPAVAVSVRQVGQLGNLDIEKIVDFPDVGGPLAGLQAALGFASDRQFEQILTLPCDAPFLPPDLLSRLEATMTSDIGATVPSTGGQLHPSCALWRTRVAAQLPDYLATGRRSLNGFAEWVGFCEVEWPVERVDPFLNINSEEDLAGAERLMAQYFPSLQGRG